MMPGEVTVAAADSVFVTFSLMLLSSLVCIFLFLFSLMCLAGHCP
jgi:hypothetical protein